MNAFLKKKRGGADKYLYLKRCHIYVSTDTTDDAVVYRDLIRWCPICPETPLLCQFKKTPSFITRAMPYMCMVFFLWTDLKGINIE